MVVDMPMIIQGFKHFSREVWYEENDNKFKLCNESGEDDDCILSTWRMSLADHTSYFGTTQKCLKHPDDDTLVIPLESSVAEE